WGTPRAASWQSSRSPATRRSTTSASPRPWATTTCSTRSASARQSRWPGRALLGRAIVMLPRSLGALHLRLRLVHGPVGAVEQAWGVESELKVADTDRDSHPGFAARDREGPGKTLADALGHECLLALARVLAEHHELVSREARD